MPVLKLPRWTKGSKITADDLNKLSAAIEASRLDVDTSTGLSTLQTPRGTKLGFRPLAHITYAVITTACPAYSTPSSVPTLGKGAGTVYYVAYSSAGVATLITTGVTGEPVYNGGKDIIATSQRVMVHQIQGQWHAIVEFCT